MIKLCRICKTEAECYPNRRVCKKCQYKQQKTRDAEKDPDELSWRRKLISIKHTYGIEPEQFEALWNAQGRVCAICKQTPEQKDIVVDHCHDTNKIRGILCRWCNVIIGKAQENYEILESAAAFVRSADTGLKVRSG